MFPYISTIKYSSSNLDLVDLQYLRMLAVAYEKTRELARDLRAVGCGDLDVEGNESVLGLVYFLCGCLLVIFKKHV